MPSSAPNDGKQQGEGLQLGATLALERHDRVAGWGGGNNGFPVRGPSQGPMQNGGKLEGEGLQLGPIFQNGIFCGEIPSFMGEYVFLLKNTFFVKNNWQNTFL